MLRSCVTKSIRKSSILSKCMFSNDAYYYVHKELIKSIAKSKDPVLQRIKFSPTHTGKWLNDKNLTENKFIEAYGLELNRTRLEEIHANYYITNSEMAFKIAKAANTLHEAFVAATEKVLNDDTLLEKFGIPKVFWDKIKQSFKEEKVTISGRFDFAFNGKELKTFEYNADSASTLVEYAVIQKKFLNSIGIGNLGRSAGLRILMELRAAWVKAKINGLVHFLIDDDIEEEYTALLVMETAEAVGIKTKLIKGLDKLKFGKIENEDAIFDDEGKKVNIIWKTWAWETAIEDYENAQIERGENYQPKPGDQPRLCDILFFDKVRVFEPLWKTIPSNKAILPIINDMFPNHPNLLKTEWGVTPFLKKTGYAQKPIVGRTGQNITIVGAEGSTLAESSGKFDNRGMIYQELFILPTYDGYHPLIGGWIINGTFAGFGIREDKSPITNLDSPCSAVLISNNEEDNLNNNSNKIDNDDLPFGAEMGRSYNNVVAYSSNYSTADPDTDFNSFIEVNNTKYYAGAKWQCVELSRRYLIQIYGVTFASIPMAYNIYKSLNHFDNINDDSPVPIKKFDNGRTTSKPQIGNLLIWGEACRHTGHVAIITEVSENSIKIVEQNWNFKSWQNRNYSRELPIKMKNENYYIEDKEEDNIIGWVSIEKV